MLIDSRDLPRDAVLEANLCIVGAGAAGITLARELSGSGVDVVILESGGLELDDQTQGLYRGRLSGESFGVDDLTTTRLRFLGGTTNHWSGQCRPFDRIDFDRRADREVSGWPFGRDLLEPYYVRAGDVLQLGVDHFDWRILVEDHGAPPALLDNDTIRTNLFVSSSVRFGEAYHQDLVDASDVRVYLWANVVDLPLTPGSDAIAQVEASTLDGRRFSVRADVYVLATGGIENARLLLAANRDRPTGLGNEHDLVGRYFCEHLQMVAGFLVADVPASQLALYQPATYVDERAPRGEFSVAASLALTDEAMQTNELLGIDALLHPAPEDEMRPSQERGADTQDVAALVDAVGTAVQSAVLVRANAEQGLHDQSRVTLTRETDALGMPRVDLHWWLDDADRSNILRGLELIGRQLGQAGIGRLQIVPGAVSTDADARDDAPNAMKITWDDLDPETFTVGIGSHHLCTTRMAASPREGVVDADCRVHSVSNLYVAGSSVFGNGSAATPTLTVVALALRLADRLRTVLA